METKLDAVLGVLREKDSSGVSDVRVNGTSITVNGVANIPVAGSTTLGVLKLGLVNCFWAGADGTPQCLSTDYAGYVSKTNSVFIGKGTLENRLCPRVAIPTLTGINPVHGVCYTHTPADAVTVTFGTPSANSAPTFELWLTMPAVPVAVAFGTAIRWADADGNFAAGNSAPDFSAGNTVYCMTFRWNGVRWLGNLAYTEETEEESE